MPVEALSTRLPGPPRRVLAGDLGGTKTLLALSEQQTDGGWKTVWSGRYASQQHVRFEDIVTDAFASMPGPRPIAACFGVAGPVDGRRVKLTYLPWLLDATTLEQGFGINQVLLVNDLAAAAAGIDAVDNDACVALQAGEPAPHGPRVVMGIGTGLGVAFQHYVGGRWITLGGEGGHMGFAPADTAQAALWAALHAEFGRVSAEQVICGQGLARIYRHLAGADSPALGLLDCDNPVGAVGLACINALQAPTLKNGSSIGAPDTLPEDARLARLSGLLWASCAGAFAGDLALSVLARGGVYLCGGVTARMLPVLRHPAFLDAFRAKGCHSGILARVPVIALTDQDIALKGAARLAEGCLKGDG